jgi:hypothetical protein
VVPTAKVRDFYHDALFNSKTLFFISHGPQGQKAQPLAGVASPCLGAGTEPVWPPPYQPSFQYEGKWAQKMKETSLSSVNLQLLASWQGGI